MDRPKRKSIPKNVRARVFNLCNGHCAYCGCEIDPKDMQVDHYLSFEFGFVIAQGKGDIDSEDNYLPSCRSCNYYKSGMHVERFREMVYRWPDILMRDSVTFRNAVRFEQVKIERHDPEFYYEKIGVTIPAMEWDQEYRKMMRKAMKEKEKKP